MRFHYPFVIAHRCGGALAPENTLAGLHVAARLGVKMVEFDAMLCADGIPVIIHDETLDRTTNGSGLVPKTSLHALQQLDAGGHQHRAFAGERIPTLVETLEVCQRLGLSVNLEIKPASGQDEATARAVVDIVKQHPLADRILLSSFSYAAMEYAAREASQIPRAWLIDSVPDDWARGLRALDACALHCAAGSVNADMVQRAAVEGWPVACYTVNRAEDAATLRTLGVAAVFTDRPDLLL